MLSEGNSPDFLDLYGFAPSHLRESCMQRSIFGVLKRVLCFSTANRWLSVRPLVQLTAFRRYGSIDETRSFVSKAALVSK